MPIKFYLEKRLNKHDEAPIRVAWSFNGDRFQSTVGFSIPPKAWNGEEQRVSPVEHNHKNTPSSAINAYLESLEKAANRIENEARVQNTTLTKLLVKKVFDDVMGAGGEFPYKQERDWKKMLKERGHNKKRYFEHFKGGKYKLLGFGKDSETLEEVVVYQALYGVGQIWVRPYSIFFSKVQMPDGTEVERFREISL